MVYCHKCGKKNDDDATYCTKCGNLLAKSSKWEEDIERAAEELGRRAEEFGKWMEKKAKEFAKSMSEDSSSKTKNCPTCKTEVDYYAVYCWKCGKKT